MTAPMFVCFRRPCICFLLFCLRARLFCPSLHNGTDTPETTGGRKATVGHWQDVEGRLTSLESGGNRDWTQRVRRRRGRTISEGAKGNHFITHYLKEWSKNSVPSQGDPTSDSLSRDTLFLLPTSSRHTLTPPDQQLNK